MAYNTGNPFGSSDFRDLSDNAVNFDKYSVGPDPAYPNRLGVLKLSIEGMNQEFNNAQDGRSAAFAAFLEASGYYPLGDYGAGITFTTRTQYTVRDGVLYRVAAATTLPYTTTGNWAIEQTKFVAFDTEALLKQDLQNNTNPTLGAALIAFKGAGAGAVGRTVAAKLLDTVSVKDFGAVGSGLVDDAPAIRAAIAYCLTILGGTKLVFPIGKYALGSRVDFPKTADTTMTIVGDRAVITRFGSYTGSLFCFGEASNTTSTAPTHVEGLIFRGPYLTPAVSPLVALQHSNGAILEKCVFQSGTIAVSMADSFAVRFVRCQFSNQTSYGIMSNTACMNLLVDSCQFSDIAAGQAAGADIYLAALTHNINIINSDFEGGREAFRSAGAVDAFNFVGNYIEGKTALPFFLGARSHGVKIENNWIGYNSGALTWYNITGGSLKYNIFWDQVQSVDVGVSTTQCIGFDVGSNAFNGTSTVVGPVWTNPSLINGYTNAGGSNPAAGYHQSSDGMVSLRGMVSGAVDNACIVLPAGLRPASLQIFASQGSTRLAGTVQITADGNVTCFRSSNGTLSLSGISFYPS